MHSCVARARLACPSIDSAIDVRAAVLKHVLIPKLALVSRASRNFLEAEGAERTGNEKILYFSFTRTLHHFRLEKLIENEKIRLARGTIKVGPSNCEGEHLYMNTDILRMWIHKIIMHDNEASNNYYSIFLLQDSDDAHSSGTCSSIDSSSKD